MQTLIATQDLDNMDNKISLTSYLIDISNAYVSENGIYLLDEKYSDNYYNDQSPRFDVKEVAKFRNNYHGSKLTMVSYTPDLDLFSKGIKNKITLIDNAGYLTNKPLHSEISVINMRDELKEGNISPLSN